MVKEIFSFVQKYDQKAQKSTPEESENLKEKKMTNSYAMFTQW